MRSKLEGIRGAIRESAAKAEEKIREALQEFHDETGMLPVDVRFDFIDSATISSAGINDSGHVSRVKLTSTI